MSLRDVGPAEVGKPVTFSVDAAQAGEGTLELVVSTQHTTIKAEVVSKIIVYFNDIINSQVTFFVVVIVHSFYGSRLIKERYV